MRYFLTGATGFIGGRVARILKDRGDEVVALVRTPARAADLAAIGVELASGDVTERESMRAPMTGVDGIFHLAAWYKVGVKNPMAEAINVQGTRNVLELMRELGVKKGVYTSTLAVFSDTRGKVVNENYRHAGPWLSEYDRTKWVAHYEVAEPMMRAGLPLVIVQPGVNYGPGDTSAMRDLFVQYLQRKLPMVPEGCKYCWAHVDDTAAAHVAAMEKGRPGETYIIGGPIHSLVEALAIAERITGVRAPRIHPSPRTMLALSKIMNLVEKVAPVPDSYTAEALRVIAGVTYIASNEKARRELGFSPRPLDEGLRETLQHEMRLLGTSPASK